MGVQRYFSVVLMVVFILFSGSKESKSQVEFGYVGGFDLYQRYNNPPDNIQSASAGNALLNVIVGPKIWLGMADFSLSIEAQVNLGLSTLSVKDYKGLGSVSFPVIAKFNIGGLTGMDGKFESGYAIGGGMQWSKTELYYLNNDAIVAGVERKFYPSYIVEFDMGGGGFGMDGYFYVRYGFQTESKANVLHFGILADISKTFDNEKAVKRELDKLDNR